MQTRQVVKITKNGSGNLFLEIESKTGMRDKIGSALEYARGRRTPREYDLSNSRAVVVEEGLRIEQENGDFFFVDIPQAEARRFVAVMEQSTSLMSGLGEK
jgi:hypothetical protein